jgi:glycosyltransferase involved in cell wall biosynthesis
MIPKKILIFIPAFNVEKHLDIVFNSIPEKIFFQKKKYKISILAINDNSKDLTLQKLHEIQRKKLNEILIFNNKRNLGYGGVQKKAYAYAIKKKFDYVIMLHGDGQYDPKVLPKFIFSLQSTNHDAIFGTRMYSYKSAIKGGMPTYKFFGNIFLTKIQNIILGTKFSEFHSGYRAYKIKSLRKISFQNFSNHFHFDTEIIIEYVIKKFSILEIPIPTRYGNEISNLKSIPYGLNILKTMFKYKIKNLGF